MHTRTSGTYTSYTLDTPSNGLEITLYTGETAIPENPANPDAGKNLDIDQPQTLKSIYKHYNPLQDQQMQLSGP